MEYSEGVIDVVGSIIAGRPVGGFFMKSSSI